MAPPVRPQPPLDAPPRTILWLLANALDCDALALWCSARVPCDAVETSAELDHGLARCGAFRPRLLVLDPSLGDVSIARALAALRHRWTSHLLILDRRPREGRVLDLLPHLAASYLSRTAGPQALADAIDGILASGQRVIDPAISSRLRRTEHGYKIAESDGKGSIAGLTLRELQVMRLLAQGKSVAACAATLGLAHSTIDNHKARLMKKLGIHKASELTCRAIRDGVIAL